MIYQTEVLGQSVPMCFPALRLASCPRLATTAQPKHCLAYAGQHPGKMATRLLLLQDSIYEPNSSAGPAAMV